MNENDFNKWLITPNPGDTTKTSLPKTDSLKTITTPVDSLKSNTMVKDSIKTVEKDTLKSSK